MVAHDLVDHRSGDQPGSVSVGLGEDDGAAKEEEGADPHSEKEIRNEAVIFPVVSSDLGETKISPSDVSKGEDADINEEEDEEKAGKYGIIEHGTLPLVQIGDFTVSKKEESGGESKNEEAKIDNQGSITAREVKCPSEEEIESSEDTEDNDMGSADFLASQSMIQVCSDVEFLVPIVEDNVFLHPVVTGGDQGTCSLNLNLEGKREKQTGVSEVKNGLARKVFVERPQSFPEGHHAAACQAQVGAMGDSMLEPNLANRRDNMPSWAAVAGRISEKNVDGTLEQNNEGMSTRCFLGKSAPLGKVAHDFAEQGVLPPQVHSSVAEAAQVGVSGDANESKGEGDVLKDPVENSSDLDVAVLEGEDSVAVEEVDGESSGEEESSEKDDSEMIAVETCTDEGEKGFSDAALLAQ
ncbi:hypothetical protein U1Q18_041673, partial [Sarracenia purpurea var. burkii]